MKLSIIIPVYNEEGSILEVIERVLAVNLGNTEKEIIIVDDGSTDGINKKLSKLNNKDFILLTHQINKGKGAAVKTALRYVSGNIVIIQDADLEYFPEDYPKLIEPIIRGESRVVYGSRILDKSNSNGRFDYYIGGKAVTFVTNLLYGSALTDEPTCYKVFDTNLLKGFTIFQDDFSWEVEITAKILKANYKIMEVPVKYRFRTVSEGKKIKYKDGLKAVFVLIAERFKDNKNERNSI